MVRTDPGDGSISAWKIQLLDSIRNAHFIAYFIAIMTVDDGIIPCDDIFPASFHDQIQLQLPVFLPAKWPNQVFEFRIDVTLLELLFMPRI